MQTLRVFISIATLLLLTTLSMAQGQPREFEMVEGDTTYIMKRYFMVFLHAGSERSQNASTVKQIQEAHLHHLDSLAQAGFITMVGPFGDSESPRGIAVYDVETAEEARKLAEADPAVKANRLRIEVRPWWCAKGSMLK